MPQNFPTRCLVAVGFFLLSGIPTSARAFDFSWFPTADTLDWFGIDNPDVGNSGWTLVPGGITTQSPDDAGDRAFINASAKTVTLNTTLTVGSVRLGFDAVNAVLNLTSGGANLTAIDEFSIGPGGELLFLGGTVNVTGAALSNLGFIHAADGFSEINASISNMATGLIQVDNGAQLTIAGAGTTLTNAATIQTIAGGALELDSGVNLTIDGGHIDNQGEFTIGNGTLNFNAGTTSGNPLELTNTVLNLDPASGGAAFAFTGGILNGNVAANQTIIQRNNGLPLVVPDSFTTAGTFRLDGLNSSQAILSVMGAGVVTNTGTFHAAALSQFGLNRSVNGTIDNQAALIIDPSVNLDTDGLVNSGTVQVGANATVTIDGPGSNSGMMDFASGSRMVVVGNGQFTHTAGNTQLEGAWEFNAGSTFDFAGGTIVGAGRIDLNSATLILSPGRGPMTFAFSGGMLEGDIDAGQTVRHDDAFSHLSTPDSFTNAGRLELAGANVNPTRLRIFGGGMITNTGELRALAGAPNSFRRTVNGSINNQGLIDIDAGVDFRADGLINTGNVSMGAGSTLTIDGGVFSQDAGTINNAGAAINDSTVNFNGGEIVGAPVVITGNSSLNFNPNAEGAAAFIHAGRAISGVIGANTTVTLQASTIGTRTITSAGSLTNEGVLQFDQSLGGIIDLEVAGLELVNETSGTLGGNGTIKLTAPGAKYINRGVHATGASAGQFDVEGDFENSTTGTLEVEIGGPNAVDYDVLLVAGAAELAGRLDLSLIGGYVPNVGDMFTILSSSGGVTGMFEQVTGAISMFDVTYNPNTVVLTAAAPSIPVDLDFDGNVDGADFLLLQRANPSLLSNWETDFGLGVPGSINARAIPEPSTIILVLAFAAAINTAVGRRMGLSAPRAVRRRRKLMHDRNHQGWL